MSLLEIYEALNTSSEGLLTPELKELKRQMDERLKDWNSGVGYLHSAVDRLNARIDTVGARMDKRADVLTDRMDKRIDGVVLLEGRILKEVAALKRQSEFSADITRRLTRIEDRSMADAFKAKAGLAN